MTDPAPGDLADLHHDRHRHPEPAFQERRTARIVAERLTVAGVETHEGIGGTGVVSRLRNGDGPTVLLRADMDALPVAEGGGRGARAMTAGGLFERSDRPVESFPAVVHDAHAGARVRPALIGVVGPDRWLA